MILRDYQESLLSEILNTLPTVKSLCVQLSTGGGKTVIFTEMIKRLDSKTLILVDGEELLQQTVNTFSRKGLDIGGLRAGGKMPNNMVVVAMIETLYNKVKKNNALLDAFKYCVIDECHVWRFNKVFPFLRNAKRIGFTATPVRLKRHTFDYCTKCESKEDCEHDKVKASELETMSQFYEKIVCGKSISWLMYNNYLAFDDPHLIDFDATGLKKDGSGEFTVNSMKEVFQKPDYQKALLKTYERICKGKKTLIFTASTETNEIFAALFSAYNVKTYDSVNNKPHERDEIVNWFRKTYDAILINTGCFTKGFDVDDVQAVIVARATASLALWIQIAGRGARITDKIEKPEFIVIDGGNNIETHQGFSFERDWNKIFSDKKFKLKVEPLQECNACGYMYPENESPCPNCGHEEIHEAGEIKQPGEKKIVKINGQRYTPKIPFFDLEFCILQGKSKSQALKLLTEKWVKFLKDLKIEKEKFERAVNSGEFHRKLKKHMKPEYQKIINSPLEDGGHRKYITFADTIIKKSYEQTI